jgi:hypothetical protein
LAGFLWPGRTLQFRDPGFNVFDLNGLRRGVITHSVARTLTEAGVDWSSITLSRVVAAAVAPCLEFGDRLGIRRPPRFPVGSLELWQLQPPHEGPHADPRCLGSFVKVALSQQGRQRDWTISLAPSPRREFRV